MEADVSLQLVDRSPWAMAINARIYLAAGGARHGLTGLMLLLMPWTFSSAVYVPLFNLLPLPVWGVLMTSTAVLCAVAAICRSTQLARIAMGISAVMTGVLGGGLSIGIGAAWMVWLSKVGWDGFTSILLAHPATYPVEMLAVAIPPPSWFFAIVMLTFAAKDVAVCASPLSAPRAKRGA